MDSSVALDPRGAGPIFLRPVLRNPPCVARWPDAYAMGVRPKPLCLGLCCRASRAELLLACVYFISMFG